MFDNYSKNEKATYIGILVVFVLVLITVSIGFIKRYRKKSKEQYNYIVEDADLTNIAYGF